MQAKKDPTTAIMRAVYFIIILIVFLLAFNAIPVLLYTLSYIDYGTLNFLSTAAVSLSFTASTLFYLYAVDKSRKGIAARLGLGGSRLTLGNIGLGLLLFFIIFMLEIAIGIASSVTGVQINTNVALLFAGAPTWFIIFASIVAPVNEEVLFRGLLVPRLGIFLSAIFFAIPHLSYDSTFAIEFIAAFIFGLLAGYVYKKTGSLYPSIVAHMLVNLLTLVTTF
ncbi:MAG: CPBP family intramembrane metalloprotease [Candidatus Micrarchaeota archaeon]|nr:CPBP family intramembrane metalloprotease [Candidatus Micrarchaeota archaeon]